MKRNWVAKHAKVCGAGKHTAKTGKYAPRCRQKSNDRKEIK